MQPDEHQTDPPAGDGAGTGSRIDVQDILSGMLSCFLGDHRLTASQTYSLCRQTVHPEAQQPSVSVV